MIQDSLTHCVWYSPWLLGGEAQLPSMWPLQRDSPGLLHSNVTGGWVPTHRCSSNLCWLHVCWRLFGQNKSLGQAPSQSRRRLCNDVVTLNVTIYNIIRAYQKFSYAVDLASWKPTTQSTVQLPHRPIRLHASEPFPAWRLVFGKHSIYQLPSSFQLDRGGLRMSLNTAFQIPPNWSERAHKIQVYFLSLT